MKQIKSTLFIALMALCSAFNMQGAQRIIYEEAPRLAIRQYVAIAGIGACTYAAYRHYSNWLEGIDKKVKDIRGNVSKLTANKSKQFFKANDYKYMKNTLFINIWLKDRKIEDIFNPDNIESNRKVFEELKRPVAQRKITLLDYDAKEDGDRGDVKSSDIKPISLISTLEKNVKIECQKISKEIETNYSSLLKSFLRDNNASDLEDLSLDESFAQKAKTFENKMLYKAAYDFAIINSFLNKKNEEFNEAVLAFGKLITMYMKLYAFDVLINDIKNNLEKYGIEQRKIDVGIGGSSSLMSRPYMPDFMRHTRDSEA